ncbi:helix-turn-helix domain-containing protein [Candidatus Parcubacteria bacterium]|nr:helix-turn-helix domain-containing protein [Candidatus Parcubacteria bacterium]
MYGSEERLLKNFGKRLAIARKNKGLTQQQLAEEAGLSVVAIAYLETGKRWARIGTLNKLSKCLNVDISDFFKGVK